MLEKLAQTAEFSTAKKSRQAELIVWFLFEEAMQKEAVSLQAIADTFEKLHLSKPNVTRLKEHFRKTPNIRKISNGFFSPTRALIDELNGLVSFDVQTDISTLDVSTIVLPPFVGVERQSDLAAMVKAYAHLFLLENSMRGLIEKVLFEHLGENWWETVSNASMKQKHATRVANEASKKWAPSRSEFGPLYALDWSDLITLMRKYPDQFKPHIKEVNFLHRFEDAGAFRNVVAHNGVLRDQDDFELIRIYYNDWVKQLTA